MLKAIEKCGVKNIDEIVAVISKYNIDDASIILNLANQYGSIVIKTIAKVEPSNINLVFDGINICRTGNLKGDEAAKKILNVLSEFKQPLKNGLKDPTLWAKVATQNGDKGLFVLGKYKVDGVSYLEVAENLKANYYNIDFWDALEKYCGSDFMWKINEKFLEMQTSAKKMIVFSHDITKETYLTGFYEQEVDFVKELIKMGHIRWVMVYIMAFNTLFRYLEGEYLCLDTMN